MAKILVVDDEALMRQVLRHTLESAGHVVAEAGDGVQALAVYRSFAPQLVVTDVIMPERDGIQTIGDLMRIEPGLPIIAISGGAMDSGDLFLTLARHLGACHTLAKPFGVDELIAAVDDCLEPQG